MKTGIKNSFVVLGFLGLMAGFPSLASAAYFDNAPAPYCGTQITQSLQVGSENNDVYVLQQMLSRAGYLNATPNGYFGYATRTAVRAFQNDNGISPTGSVGAATINAINERLCDADPRGTTLSYANYGGNYSGYPVDVTYVDAYDPYVKVVSPVATNPTIYTNPATNVSPVKTYSGIPTTYSTSNVAPSVGYSNVVTNGLAAIVPATTQTQIQSTNVIYSPSLGYTYGIVPQSGSLTISTPTANAIYNEGDTVTLAWATSNLNVSQYQILLENITTGKSQQVAVTSSNGASFVLSKDILDAVCYGTCDNNQQGSFRIVIATPMTDIAGTTSTFRAAVSPITIKRPSANFGTVSLTTNKNPVNSGDIFKLYVNIPTGASWNANLYGNYSFKIKAVCPVGVQASIAGVPCGQDFTIPFAPTYFQSEIPVSITNASWFTQNVTFQLTVTNLLGQVIGNAATTVTASAAPFNW
jgi:peptidoglycan hydrolase-like protein with peptidoglycan-binding domain